MAKNLHEYNQVNLRRPEKFLEPKSDLIGEFGIFLILGPKGLRNNFIKI